MGDVALFKGTGKCIDNLVKSLVLAAADRNDETRHAIGVSLLSIARKETSLVLSACMVTILQSTLGKGTKIDHAHRVALLRLMGRVIDDVRGMSGELVKEMTAFCIGEMTGTRDVVSDQQGAASAVLVAISVKGFHEEVMTELLAKLKTGDVPFYFVMKTLGDLALANPEAFLPRLKDVMTRLLPTFGQIKHSHIRYIYARCFGAIAEGVAVYFNSEAGKSQTKYTIDNFHSEFFTAFDMFFNKWLGDKEEEVRHSTAHALAHIGAVINRPQFEETIPRLVPAVIGLYKKCNKPDEMLVLTKGLTRLLEVCTLNGSRVLDLQLPLIFTTIHPLACKPVDYEVAVSSQLHAELLRCFEVLIKVFCDNLLNFLIERMTAREPQIRIGTLDVLKHLVNRSSADLSRLGDLVVSGVKQMMYENDAKVAFSLSQLLMVMGSEGYLVHEGGASLITFLVSHCAGRAPQPVALGTGQDSEKKDGQQQASSGLMAKEPKDLHALRTSCERIIDRLASDVPGMENVLWPLLFEYIIPVQYTEALPVVFRNIALLGTRKREKGDSSFYIDFNKNVNAPKPHAIVGRLLVLLNAPGRKEIGQEIIKALIAIGPILGDSIARMWEAALPRLLQFLKNKFDTPDWDDSIWTELTFRLFRETLENVSDEEWLIHLSEDLAAQFDLYMRDAELKKCLFIYLGLVLQKVSKRSLIRGKLDRMFDVVDHNSTSDRQSCAQGFGYAAASHMDTALEKLQHALKNDCVRKSSGFFGMVKDKTEKDIDNMKSTVMLAYGYVAAHAPAGMVTTRLEVHILNSIFTPEIADCKTITRKIAVIRALDMMAKAAHPTALGTDFTLKARDDLLTKLIGLVTVVTPQEINMEIRVTWTRACASLAALPPILTPEMESKMIDATLKFLALPPGSKDQPAPSGSGGSGGSAVSSPAQPAKKDPKDAKKAEAETPAGNDSSEMEALLTTIASLFSAVISANPTLECLKRLLKTLESSLFSPKSAVVRARAMDLVLHLLKKVIDMIGEGTFRVPDGRWKGIGVQIALLIPRLADMDSNIRRNAMEGLELMLYIDFLLTNTSGGARAHVEPPEKLNAIKELANEIVNEDVTQQVTTIWNFSTILADLVTAIELPVLLETLLTQSQDSETETVSASVVVLNGILGARGSEMAASVPSLVQGLVNNLAAAKDEKNINGIIRSFRTLAKSHLKAVVDEMLNLPLPHPPHVVKCVQVLTKSKDLLPDFLSQILDTINLSKFIERIPDQKNAERPNMIPLAATCTLGEIFETKECGDLITEQYAKVVSTLLLRVGTSLGINKGEASKYTVTAFKKFVDLREDTATRTFMDAEGRWDKLNAEETYLDVLSEMVTYLAKDHRSKQAGMFEFVQPFINGANDKQKIASITIIAQLLGCCGSEDTEFIRQLLNILLARQTDKTTSIKVQAMRGLGNLSATGTAEVNRYSSHVLMALLHGVEDSDENVALTAMNSLALIFDVIDSKNVTPMMVNLTLRIRSSFDKPNEKLRLAAHSLFATLCKFSHTEDAARENFGEQIHSNLVCVVLHARDDSHKVREACNKTMIEIGIQLGADGIKKLMTEQASDTKEYYDDFLSELSQLLVTHFAANINMYIQHCMEYFKQQSLGLKANSATFACSLLAAAKSSTLSRVDPDNLCKELVVLLRDNGPVVRTKAARGMSLLYEY